MNIYIYSTLDSIKTSAKNEYVDIFESLGEGGTIILITVVAIIVISLLFMITRSTLFAAKVAAEAQREREEAQQALEAEELERRANAGPMQLALEDREDAPFLLAILEGAWVPPADNRGKGNDKKDDEEDDDSDKEGRDDERSLVQQQQKDLVDFTEYFHELVSADDPDGVCLKAALAFLDNHQE